MRLSLFILAVAVSTPCVANPGAAAPGEKMICKSEAATGSILKKKTCRTKAEWDAMTQASRNDLDRLNAMDRSRSGVAGNR